ncbi:MAG: hypothetical protein Q9194_001469 [Teloschistes cf. exilis]
MASAVRKTFSVSKTIPTAVSGDILEAVALGQRPWYERFRGQHNEHLHVDVRFDGEDAMARCSMFALIGVSSVISVAEVHKVEVQKVEVQNVEVWRLLHISIIVGIVHLTDWVGTFCTPPNEATQLKTDPNSCQTLRFTGKRKDDAESMDQAPKRTKNMGRPPILTESQKRKLVRLYLFTNLDMDDIGKIMGFRHKTPKKRTLQHILRETLNDGYHLHRPKDRAARKNRLLQVSFARGDETSNSGSQRSPQFRIISTPTPKETNSESRVSNASSANPSKGTAKDNTAQRDATGLGASTHDDDPDWINLVHWDEDYICQQTPLQGARGEHHTTNGDETRINSAAAMTLPLSITQSPMQLSYTLDDLQEDIRRFVKQGQMDLDGLLTDSMDTETETEDPVPTFELGRSLTNDLSDGCVDDTSAQGSDQTEKEVFPDSSSSNGLDFQSSNPMQR